MPTVRCSYPDKNRANDMGGSRPIMGASHEMSRNVTNCHGLSRDVMSYLTAESAGSTPNIGSCQESVKSGVNTVDRAAQPVK